MNWIRINITSSSNPFPENFSEDIANLLIISGVDTFTTDDYSDLEEVLSQGGIFYDYIDDSLLSLKEQRPVVHAFLEPGDEGEKICEAVYRALGELKTNPDYSGLEWNTDVVKDEDWENNWKEFFKPFPVGDKLYIKPSWESLSEEERSNRLVIEIDPSSSFGTGTHATTKLCLERLEEVIRGGEKVLDMGCGSGILSIGALLLGADNVLAVDIDETAARIAKENIEINGFCEDKARVYCGNVLEDSGLVETVGKGYDVICANIVAGIIIEMAPLFKSVLNLDGYLLASGIISERENEVKDALIKHNFEIISTYQDDGWSLVLAKKS